MHRGDAVRLLDVSYAAEHLTTLRKALSAWGHTFPPTMLERCMPVLTHRRPGLMVRMADYLLESDMAREDVREHLGSVRTRRSLLHSPTF